MRSIALRFCVFMAGFILSSGIGVASEPADERLVHWAFQPVQPISPPAVTNGDWIRNEIDAFVLRRLEAEQLQPAPPAERRRWLRRATFDLTGLPPTVEEVDAFLADESDTAFEAVVERLLASSRYGERWARHWLDGVRYVSDVGYYNFSDLGWRYRDWVIRALNDDMPYDWFVMHQIAGDLLPRFSSDAPYADGIIATGVLAMGNYDDQESDKEKLYAEVIDDQIDLVGRQFLGLTLACARCHDHKHDPITAEDYYALGGIFMSSQVLETSSRIGAHRLKVALDPYAEQERRKAVAAEIGQLEKELKALEKTDGEQDEARIGKLRERLAERKQQLPGEPTLAIGVRDGGYDNSRHKEIGDMPVYVRGNPYSLGSLAPRRFPVVLAGEMQTPIGERTDQSGRLELAQWIASPENPLTARVMVNRIWMHHFGEGLVRTPNNFGRLGQNPSHPGLLDYLAHRFVASGWSIKDLHRLIMNSATYRQSTKGSEPLFQSDPENILLGRFSPRRLSSEEIHDALLAVSGDLNEAAGNQHGNRAIYDRVGHLHSSIVASLFDAPATGTILARRTESTTAPQALYMMNNEAVVRAARRLAQHILGSEEPRRGHVNQAYEVLYGRGATARERSAGVAYLESVGPEEAWTYFQVLLCANEFMYVD